MIYEFAAMEIKAINSGGKRKSFTQLKILQLYNFIAVTTEYVIAVSGLITTHSAVFFYLLQEGNKELNTNQVMMKQFLQIKHR